MPDDNKKKEAVPITLIVFLVLAAIIVIGGVLAISWNFGISDFLGEFGVQDTHMSWIEGVYSWVLVAIVGGTLFGNAR